MRFKEKLIKAIYEKHPNLTRRDQYRILSFIVKTELGIIVRPRDCREICNLQRAIRLVIPRDAKTPELEREAKVELGYRSKKKTGWLFG